MKLNKRHLLCLATVVYAVAGFIVTTAVWASPAPAPELPDAEPVAAMTTAAVTEPPPPETTAPETTTELPPPEPVYNKNDVFEKDVITVNNSGYTIGENYTAALLDIFDDYRFETAFYIIDLESQASFGYNADNVFSAASTVKAGFALYCFKQIAAGNAKYTDCMTYREHHFIKGSGSTQNSEFGTLFTLKALLYRLLYNSDNVAYLMLVDYFGYEGYNEMVTELGVTNTIGKSKFGDLTPHDLGLIWQEIYAFKDTCDEGRLLWEYLTTNLYNELREEMGDEYEIMAHKSGWNSVGYHEAGVVVAERPYVVAVMTRTGKNRCLHKTIRFCDDLMKDFTRYMNEGN